MPYVIINNQRVAIELNASQKIGEGGMGVVYRLPHLAEHLGRQGSQKLVAKIFKDPADPKNPSREKLTTMIERPPAHVYEVINGVGYTQFAWVRHVILDDKDQLIGYAMPELDFDRSMSLNPFIYPNEGKRLTAYQNSLNYRVQLGANISALMADLHAHGHAFIDFKEPNLRLMPEPVAYGGANQERYNGFIVGFIDCDSYRITRADGKVYPSPVISPEMTSPEYHEHKNIALLDEKHDRFVLAIELFKILNNGIHPFYFIPLSDRLKNLPNRNTDQFIKERLYAYGQKPHPDIAPLKNSIHEAWDDATRALFDQAFLATEPNARPNASDWETHLRGLVQGRQFVVCDNFPNDASHIHFVGKPCHQCMRLTKQTPIHNDAAVTTAMSSPPSVQPSTQSVWKVSELNPATASQNSTHPRDGATEVASGAADAMSLAQNRQWEQSLNQQRPAITPSQPVTPSAHRTDVIEPQTTTAFDLHHASGGGTTMPTSGESTPGATVPVAKSATTPTTIPPKTLASTPATATNPATLKKSHATPGKHWLMPAIIAALALGGYGVSMLWNDKSPTGGSQAATASANTNADTGSAVSVQASYRQAVRELPTAKATIEAQLSKHQQSSLFGPSAKSLYQQTLGIQPAFFSQVQAVADQGKRELGDLTQLANGHDIAQVQQQALSAFRGADMGYFAKQPVNNKLAKQFNEAAKNYYWNKKDPKGALYLQAQALNNAPNQGEYAANFAFYLFKNGYPTVKDFVLYALQTPRDASKYPNTYMIELAAALAAKEGDTKSAIGALLTQYYTADDKAKRCQNMLRYPNTYPELVPAAKAVLQVINEQHIAGVATASGSCLPPLNWAS